MRKIKKFDNFISEEIAPMIEQPEIDIKPGKPLVEPPPPSIIPDEAEENAPAKAQLPMASAKDVADVFMELLNKSGKDIKKYVK
jgi:hypothetical protein